MFNWVKTKVNGLFSKPVQQTTKKSKTGRRIVTEATGRKKRVNVTPELESKILLLYKQAVADGRDPYGLVTKETFASKSTVKRVLAKYGITPVRAYKGKGKVKLVAPETTPRSYRPDYSNSPKGGYDSLKALANLPPRPTKTPPTKVAPTKVKPATVKPIPTAKFRYKKSWLNRNEVLNVWQYKGKGYTWEEIALKTGVDPDIVGNILRQKKYTKYTKGVAVV